LQQWLADYAAQLERGADLSLAELLAHSTRHSAQ
jgi:hypothetical protein